MLYDFISVKQPESVNSWRQKVDQWLLEAGGLGNGEIADGYGVSFGADENFLKLDNGDACTTL